MSSAGVCTVGKGKAGGGRGVSLPFRCAGTPSTMSSPASTPSRRGSRRGRITPAQTRKSLPVGPARRITLASLLAFSRHPGLCAGPRGFQFRSGVFKSWHGVRCADCEPFARCSAISSVRALCEAGSAGPSFPPLPSCFLFVNMSMPICLLFVWFVACSQKI